MEALAKENIESVIDLQVEMAKTDMQKDVQAGAIDLSGVKNFGDLHDFVDANMYLGGPGSKTEAYCDKHGLSPEQSWVLFNAVSDRLDHWIRDGKLHHGNSHLVITRLDNPQDLSVLNRLKTAMGQKSPAELMASQEITSKRFHLLQSWEKEAILRSRKRQKEIRQLRNGLNLLADLGHGKRQDEPKQALRRSVGIKR